MGVTHTMARIGEVGEQGWGVGGRVFNGILNGPGTEAVCEINKEKKNKTKTILQKNCMCLNVGQ